MSTRINKRVIIKDDKSINLEGAFRYLRESYLWSETEMYMLAGYLYNHDSDAEVYIEDTNSTYSKFTITKGTFKPNFKEFLDWQNQIDNHLNKYK